MLELGNVWFWVLSLLFTGVDRSAVFDVGFPERVFSEPMAFEFFPRRWARKSIEMSRRGVIQVQAHPAELFVQNGNPFRKEDEFEGLNPCVYIFMW